MYFIVHAAFVRIKLMMMMMMMMMMIMMILRTWLPKNWYVRESTLSPHEGPENVQRQ